MSIAEYQLSLKNLIDATTNETILKRWKTQLEADLEHGSENTSEDSRNNPVVEQGKESKSDKKEDTSDYVVIESGLGIDE